MNEKLRNHVKILFAVAPKTDKTEEIKEELLTSLNDKYNDLLANGYDQAAAFHIALSGIGDINELLKECGKSQQPNVPASSDSNIPQSTRRIVPTWLLILFAIALFLLGPTVLFFSMFDGVRIDHNGIRAVGVNIDHQGVVVEQFPFILVSFMFLCWAIGIALIAYAVIRSAMSDRGETFTAPWETAAAPPGSSTHDLAQTPTKEEIRFKKVVAGILAILLGWLGIHKFYLGFIGTGITMLLITVLSLGILSYVMWIIGFIEGLLYLLKSDRDFYRDYEVRRRNWF